MSPLSKCIILVAIIVSAIAACKKESVDADIKLTEADNGKLISVTRGETIAVTAGDPGDSGYQTIDPKFDATVLTLNSRSHQNPKNPKMLGDFGTNTWKFTAISTGKTTLKIPAVRGANTDTLWVFSNQITVN
ncbi:protease inhibitor I42 family protein [Mucilaginibacter agri]|uniref:Proteinase inhibitor I42 chagasin domain-containing protein n=1 Tax=Mucilaginibacter agri TaxID=2695265 RepID=A0A965ZKB1_9SPHI|nr:protease inhibitor I42 family protein [Mucilaginibacter agri]NCD72260.1 hypothetical protein [Mucilaginibacter agri]